jgi:hypothetical protein
MTNEQLYLSVSVIGNLILGIRYLYRKVRNADIAQAFVDDMATNHLPHIQHALTLIADAMHISLPEPPPIRFVSFKDKS